MKYKNILLLFTLLNLSACGAYQAFDPCAHRLQSGDCYQATGPKIDDPDLLQVTQQAAHALLQVLDKPLDKDKALLVTSLADVNHLEQTSALGRVLSEQLAAHFTRSGYTVREVRFRQDLLVEHDNGEFILSRSLPAIFEHQPVAMIMTGTYAVAQSEVYVSLKILNVDGIALASHLLALPLGENIQRLLMQQ